MGLDEFVEDKKTGLEQPKLNDPSLCPRCGQRGEETEHWYWRCNNSDCSAIVYIPVERVGGVF